MTCACSALRGFDALEEGSLDFGGRLT